MMKNTKKDFLLPGEAVEACGFRPSDALCFHAGQDTLIVTPEDMTAMQAVNAIDALTELSTTLICALLNACERCGECPDGCPFEGAREPDAALSEEARLAAGIPLDEKLELEIGDGGVRVTAAGYEHDITDVSDSVRRILANAGACLGSLDELLMENGVVFHG